MSFHYRRFQFFVFFCVFSLSIGCTWNASGSDSWPNISYGAGGTVSDVENFVTRFYQQCLSREPDTAGLNGWVNDLNNGLKAGDTLAEAFVFSSEFQNRNTSNSEFLTILYKAFFNREPDTSGYNYWVNDMSNGASRSEVLAGFTSAQEFINLCQDYGISPKAPSNNDNPVTEFVTRFYQQCLNREPDTAGLNGWVNDLNGGLKAGDTLAEAFVFSSEFQNRNTSNSEFLTILYKAFFNRDPDASGYNNWINSMSSGTGRSEVLAGFTSAQEFINLCGNYQIRPTISSQNIGCDSNHFNLCASSETCSSVGRYWYNNICNSSPESIEEHSEIQGTWMMKQDLDQYYTTYFTFDSSNTVDEVGSFNYFIPAGNYQLNQDNSFQMTIINPYDSSQTLEGQLISGSEAILSTNGSKIGVMKKVIDLSTCQGFWHGTMSVINSSTTYNISFSIDSSGAVTSWIGFSQTVSGDMFCQSGNITAFFKTSERDAYHQIQFGGNYGDNTITGIYMIDDGSSNDPDGTFYLTR